MQTIISRVDIDIFRNIFFALIITRIKRIPETAIVHKSPVADSIMIRKEMSQMIKRGVIIFRVTDFLSIPK